MKDDESIAQRIANLQELEEVRFLVYFHQIIEKSRQKSWHDGHIKFKIYLQGDNVLLYDSQSKTSRQVAHALIGFIHICGNLTLWCSQDSTTGWYPSTRMGEWHPLETLYFS
jgi:hypothetical protein